MAPNVTDVVLIKVKLLEYKDKLTLLVLFGVNQATTNLPLDSAAIIILLVKVPLPVDVPTVIVCCKTPKTEYTATYTTAVELSM